MVQKQSISKHLGTFPARTFPQPNWETPEKTKQKTAGYRFVYSLTPSSLIPSISPLSSLFKPVPIPQGSTTVIDDIEEPSDFPTQERQALKKLKTALFDSRPDSVEEQLQQLALVEHLAQQYLLMEAEDGSEDDGLRLAEETYELLGEIAGSSNHEEVYNRAPYYDALRVLISGDELGARAILTDEVKDLPEAKSILEILDLVEKTEQNRQTRDGHRMLALSVLDIWSTYADEGEAYELDQANGVLGVGIGTIRYYTESGNKTMPDHVAAKWNLDRDLIHEIKVKIQKDEAETVHEALVQIVKDSGRFGSRAQQLLDEEQHKDNNGSYLLAHLISYVSDDYQKPKLLHRLMKDADNAGSRMNAVQTPYAIYSLLIGE